MATYVLLTKLTDQGARNIKDLPARMEAFKKSAPKFGAEVREAFLAIGPYDTLSLVSAPDDESVCKLALSLCALGNVHTETLRLFSEGEIKKLIAGLS